MSIEEKIKNDLYWEHSQHNTYQEGCSTCWMENLVLQKKEIQQKLREWILKQKYLYLAPEYDGMTAWELAGMILKVINEN